MSKFRHTVAELDAMQSELSAALERPIVLDFADDGDGIVWGVWDGDDLIGRGGTPEEACADARSEILREETRAPITGSVRIEWDADVESTYQRNGHTESTMTLVAYLARNAEDEAFCAAIYALAPGETHTQRCNEGTLRVTRLAEGGGA